LPTTTSESESATVAPCGESSSTTDNTYRPQNHPQDVALFVSGVAGHSRDIIYDYLINVWKPPRNYKFPKKSEYGKMRSFKSGWLDQYLWLAYSPSLDGAFCLPCVLFARDLSKQGVKLDRLLSSPLTSATRKFKDHELNSEVHKCSLLMASEFKKTMANTSIPVQHRIDCARVKQIKENRAKLTSILKTVILCGQQNLPLRGHRDDSKYYNTKCAGNFQRLLEFRVDAEDTVLKNHIEACKNNATYRSKTIQNELISCCCEYITKILIDDKKV